MAAVRFVRDGVQSPRLNFVGIDQFPLREGQEATLFACVHGMGTADVLDGNRVSLDVTDERGRTLHSYSYEGDITGLMMGLADTFTPSEAFDTFTITAELSRNGEVVDRAELDYDWYRSRSLLSPFFGNIPSLSPAVATALILVVILGIAIPVALFYHSKKETP